MISRGPKITTDSLVLHLDAANKKSYGGSGSTWKDLSKYKNNCTLVNSPAFSTDGIGSIVFNGISNYATMSRKFLSLISLGTEITFCFWYKGSGNPRSVFRLQYASAPYIVPLWWNASGPDTLRFITSVRGAYVGPTISKSSLNNGLWNFVSCVYKKDNIWGIYVNGILMSTDSNHNFTLPVFNTTEANLFQMFSYVGGSEFTEGNVSIGMIYNKALSSDEVNQNFNATRSRFNV